MSGGELMAVLIDASGWALLAGGVVLAGWALLRDRSRGRRRCPRCWYSMEGVPGLTCPECGRAVSSERSLRRTRRSWRVAVVGLMVALCSWTPRYAVDAAKDGWIEALPNGLLIAALPLVDRGTWDPEDPAVVANHVWDEVGRRLDEWVPVGHARRFSRASRWVLAAVVALRASDFELRNGGWYRRTTEQLAWSAPLPSWLQARLWRISGETMVKCRDKWPRGVPLRVRLDGSAWWHDAGPNGKVRELVVARDGGFLWKRRYEPTHNLEGRCGGVFEAVWEDGTVPWGGGDEPMSMLLALREADRPAAPPLWTSTIALPVTLVDRVEQITMPIPDEQVGAWLIRSMTLDLAPHAVTIGLAWRECPLPLTVALRVRFECDGREMATARWWGRMREQSWSPWAVHASVELEGDGDRVAAADLSDGHWSIRVESDAEFALRDFESDRHWDGAFVLDPARVTLDANRRNLRRSPRW